MKIYRFRSARYILEQYEELERQEIYFSPPDNLNDPMEGYKDIYWQGDAVAWKSLYEHYLLCLMTSYSIFSVSNSEFSENEVRTIIRKSPGDLPPAPVRETYRKICDQFFKRSKASRFIEQLSLRNTRVHRDELIFHLRFLHATALKAVLSVYRAKGMIAYTPRLYCIKNDLKGTFFQSISTKLIDMLDNSYKDRNKSTATFSAAASATKQLELIDIYNNTRTTQDESWRFLCMSFPESYVNNLNEMIHPKWLTACFTSTPLNASMWGTYGDNHRGVCLIFDADTSNPSRPELELRHSFNVEGKIDNLENNNSYTKHKIEEVAYTEEYPSMNFFTSIGRISTGNLVNFWYKDGDGSISECYNEVFFDKESWRKTYWNNFQLSTTCKTKEWEHEKEVRIVIDDFTVDNLDESSRKFSYKFKSLSGIIFGIRTPTSDIIAIIKIIKEKCMREKRLDFTFFQIKFNPTKGILELERLTLLNVN